MAVLFLGCASHSVVVRPYSIASSGCIAIASLPIALPFSQLEEDVLLRLEARAVSVCYCH